MSSSESAVVTVVPKRKTTHISRTYLLSPKKREGGSGGGRCNLFGERGEGNSSWVGGVEEEGGRDIIITTAHYFARAETENFLFPLLPFPA